MVLIIGGAYQGKRAYAEAMGYEGDAIVGGVEEMVRAMLRDGKDPQAALEPLCDTWRDKAVLLTDISCGVVPLDAADRAWREAVGRCGAALARHADQVVRVFCGLGTVLKDA